MIRRVETGVGVLSALSLLAVAVYVAITPALVAFTYPPSYRSMMVMVPDIPLWQRSASAAMLILVLGLVGCTTIALAAYADSQAPRRVTLVGLWALAIALLAVVLVTPLHLIGVFSTPPVLALATASVATLSRRSPTP